MNRPDIIALSVAAVVIGFFCFVPGAFDGFRALSAQHGFILSFVKFAILATFGECLALRLLTGKYNRPGFGVLPKMVVWGFLGVGIKTAFVIFATGTPQVLAALGIPVTMSSLSEGPFLLKVITAFSVSVAMNCSWAPFLMTVHKVSDLQIQEKKGDLCASFSSMDVAALLHKVDWKVMWNFVFKKTIPFFWIPAHTITFLMPSELRILVAAILGMMLGVILAFAANRRPKDACASAA